MIEEFVQAASDADGDRIVACVTDDATFELPGGRTLPPGEAGARAFADRHAETDGRDATVELLDVKEAAPARWVLSLRFVQREVATGDVLYELTVGGLVGLRDDRIASLRAFASADEAAAAAG